MIYVLAYLTIGSFIALYRLDDEYLARMRSIVREEYPGYEGSDRDCNLLCFGSYIVLWLPIVLITLLVMVRR